MVSNDVTIQTIDFGPIGSEAQLEAALNSEIDALVITTDGFFPSSTIPYFARFQDIGVPVFIPTGALWEARSREKAGSKGATSLPTYPDQNWGLTRGLDRVKQLRQSIGIK